MSSFLIDISLEGFHFFDEFCKCRINFKEKEQYWLSWTLFGNVFQSESFMPYKQEPKKIRDIVKFKCNDGGSTNFIPSEILSSFPLRIFLCTENEMVAFANFDPFKLEDVKKDKDYLNFPFSFSEWAQLIPLDEENFTTNDLEKIEPSLKLSVEIFKEENPDEKYDEDDFEQEESEEVEYSSKKEIIIQEPKKSEPIPEEINEDDKFLRHYRFTVEMKSIGGLKRPAHVSLQFIYPFLGASSPVRTRPTWVQAYSEAKIDKGIASYECVFTREKIRNIFSAHPLKIMALTRSHLGNNLLGEINVDLTPVTFVEPHSYRCPVTGRIFHSLDDYKKHRQTLYSLMAAGKVDRVPPKQPVTIYALDSYLVFNAPSADSKATIDLTSSTNNDLKSNQNYIVPLAEGGKLRLVLILEDIGVVGSETATDVRPGYKMHNGGLYEINEPKIKNLLEEIEEGHVEAKNRDSIEYEIKNPLNENLSLTPKQKAELEKMKLDWEAWRRNTEAQWRESMQQKESLLRKKLEQEMAQQLASKADDLRRAQEETAKLEVRLKASIESVERQRSQLQMKEEQVQVRLAQKTSELQLLQRRIKEEAKVLVDGEKKKVESLKMEVSSLKDSLNKTDQRLKETEKDFENFRSFIRNSPENLLREENARLRAQLSESKHEIEKERRLRAERELEKEHFRTQMHRLAMALKREREKNTVAARQELEQLRLEFLAREERYILDGDREELRSIRNELAVLKNSSV